MTQSKPPTSSYCWLHVYAAASSLQQGGTLCWVTASTKPVTADGPTLAATKVRTTFNVPSALQTASSEHSPLSLYKVICCSLV